MNPDDRTLGDVGVRGNHRLHRAGRQAVPGDVDDVVGAPHDVDVAIFVDESSVTTGVVAGMVAEVGRYVAIIVSPQCWQRSRR